MTFRYELPIGHGNIVVLLSEKPIPCERKIDAKEAKDGFLSHIKVSSYDSRYKAPHAESATLHYWGYETNNNKQSVVWVPTPTDTSEIAIGNYYAKINVLTNVQEIIKAWFNAKTQ